MRFPRVSNPALHTHRWKKARAAYLTDHPLCVPCEKAGNAVLADVVHHKVPHNGNPGHPLFWVRSNWEGRCTTCHADAQKLEQGQRQAETYRGCDVSGQPLDPMHHWQGGQHVPRFSRSYIPEGVSPIGPRLTIVCGPPRAGKTTWVEEHKGPNDVVVDLDVYEGTLDQRYAQRDEALTQAAKGSAPVWLIIGAPSRQDRELVRVRLQPGRTLVIETPLEVCLDRALGDSRPGIPEAIRRWWQAYQPDHGVAEPNRHAWVCSPNA